MKVEKKEFCLEYVSVAESDPLTVAMKADKLERMSVEMLVLWLENKRVDSMVDKMVR